ncbi:MAG: hypothetical protein M3Z37_04210 [Candidatus Eremiobacteraeota bacterium]|nr:hypothetical protein [Candidatus Eremiobacteraeota bacterium]
MTHRRSAIDEIVWLAGALLRQRALAARRDWSTRTFYLVAMGAGLFLFCFIFVGSFEAARTLQDNHAMALLASIPAWAFLIYLFTDIFIAFGQALGDLYLASDMPVLMSMPLRTSSIVVAKFVGGVMQNEVYVVAFLVPFVLGFFLGTHTAWWAYAPALLGVLVFPAMLYAALSCVTILTLRYVPARHAKETLWLLGATVPTVFWVMSFSGIAQAKGDLSTLQLPQAPWWLPSTWIGGLISASALGQPLRALSWLGLLVFAAVVACPASLAFISSAFRRGWTQSETIERGRGATRVLSRPRESAWVALFRKDLLTLLRTPQLWFSHITSLGFVGYLLVGHKVQTPLLPLTVQLAMLQIGFVSILAGLNPGMTAISLEHGAAWMLRAMPLRPADVLRAKLAVTLGQTALVVLGGAAALAYGYGFGVARTFALVLFALLMATCSVCCGVLFDTTFPSFQWENPNAINRGVRMIIPFLAGVAVLLLCAALLASARVVVHGERAVVVGLACSAVAVAWVSKRTLQRSLHNLARLEI